MKTNFDVTVTSFSLFTFKLMLILDFVQFENWFSLHSKVFHLGQNGNTYDKPHLFLISRMKE